jgi:tetratricopeptide (TPR) repeat protein
MIDARSGEPMTTDRPAAASQYRLAMDRILGSETGTTEALDRALELDGSFALALAARYMLARDAGSADAGHFRERALLAAEAALPWERAHITALFALLENPYGNLAATEAYIAANSCDLLVISQLCGYLIFYGGERKLERVLHIMEAVDPSLQDDWACLARLGFAASEAGDQRRGRVLVERALQQRPQAPYVIHSYAHVLHDQGRPEESLELLGKWLDEYRESAEGGAMYGHVQWHLAVAEWQLGRVGQAWQRYERYCAPETTRCGPVLTLADCGGFLLREYLRTGVTRPVSAAVSALYSRFGSMISHPFVALHLAGIQASAGDLAALEKTRAAIETAEQDDQARLALRLVEAVSQFAGGRYADAADTLKGVSPAQRIGVGGSRVERMLIDLLEARARNFDRKGADRVDTHIAS